MSTTRRQTHINVDKVSCWPPVDKFEKRYVQNSDGLTLISRLSSNGISSPNFQISLFARRRKANFSHLLSRLWHRGMEVNKCRSKSDQTRKWHHFCSARCTAAKKERQKHRTRENAASPLTVPKWNTLIAQFSWLRRIICYSSSEHICLFLLTNHTHGKDVRSMRPPLLSSCLFTTPNYIKTYLTCNVSYGKSLIEGY